MKVVGAGPGGKSRRRKRLREVWGSGRDRKEGQGAGRLEGWPQWALRQPWSPAWGAGHYTPKARGTRPHGVQAHEEDWGRGGEEEGPITQGGCVEVCKCRFTKLVPVAWGLTLTHPGEATGKQEPPDGT